MLHGLFGVVKPFGKTSQDVCAIIKKLIITHTKYRDQKVGHGGTLDPFATGVLPIGLGDGCKILSKYQSGNKEYLITAKLGEETDTLDIQGKIVKTCSFQHVTKEKILSVLPKFTGEILQVPPAFSAKRIQGQRAYNLAREGKVVNLAPVKVNISSIEMTKFELPYFQLRVICGGGTYMRKLVQDISIEVGTFGFASALERTQHGVFKLEDCLPVNEWNIEKILEEIKKRKIVLGTR